MDFSRPENARRINRLKVLSALRKKPASKAELAAMLQINKVSIGEICESLRSEGLIEESGKEMRSQGRPGVLFSINSKAGRVFSIIISEKAASVAVSDTLGRILRFERFPKAPSFSEDLRRVMAKLAGNARIYGIAIVSDEDIQLDIDAPSIRIPFSVAEASAEMARSGPLGSFLFISWGYSITASFSFQGTPVFLPEFGHIRASREGRCGCGGKGCLDAVASGRALLARTGHPSLKSLMQDKAALRDALQPMAAGIAQGVQALSAESVMITGAMSQMDDALYAYLQNLVSSLLPPRRSGMVIYRGAAGENGAAEGAAILALDTFFYDSALLAKLEAIESLSSPAL